MILVEATLRLMMITGLLGWWSPPSDVLALPLISPICPLSSTLWPTLSQIWTIFGYFTITETILFGLYFKVLRGKPQERYILLENIENTFCIGYSDNSDSIQQTKVFMEINSILPASFKKQIVALNISRRQRHHNLIFKCPLSIIKILNLNLYALGWY